MIPSPRLDPRRRRPCHHGAKLANMAPVVYAPRSGRIGTGPPAPAGAAADKAGACAMSEEFKSRARKWPKGNHYEDFELGHVYQHHWGRTLNDGDNSLFSTLTLGFNPLYFNADYAGAHGHQSVVLNPMLIFLTVFGLSVEDLSEAGGLFLGVDQLKFHRTVYPGETLSARSTVLDKRESSSRPESGIVTWHTEGRDSRGALVIDFRRTNLVSKRNAHK
jgi:acyl dehydratase